MRYLLVLISLVLSACMSMTTGEKFDGLKINKIKTGTSTKENVLSLMGAPLEKHSFPDGTSRWQYQFMAIDVSSTATSFIPIVGAFKGGKSESNTQLLMVSFNKSGMVTSCTYNTFSRKDSGGMMSMGAGASVENEMMKCEDVK